MKRGGLSYCGIKTLRDTIVLIQAIARIMYILYGSYPRQDVF